MEERTSVTKFKGNPVTLLGPELKVGDKAPDFEVVDDEFKPVTLADFKGKTKILFCVPSLDTPIYDAEVRRFNQEAAQLSDNTVALAMSIDLPFAQKRWCVSSSIDRVKTLSDYQSFNFGLAYGILIKELKLLSRSIFIINAEDKITYIQHVAEITEEPDYAAVLTALKTDIYTKEIPVDGICGGY